MKKSSIFYGNTNREMIERKIQSLLNKQEDFLSDRTIESPRAVGDAIENIIVENFKTILGNLASEYSSTFARRAMADLAFTDKDGFYYIVDVKTHRLDIPLSDEIATNRLIFPAKRDLVCDDQRHNPPYVPPWRDYDGYNDKKFKEILHYSDIPQIGKVVDYNREKAYYLDLFKNNHFALIRKENLNDNGFICTLFIFEKENK